MIKTVGLLVILVLLYGLAGRADFEIAEATAKERGTCLSCPCEDDGMRSMIQSPAPRRLKRVARHPESPRRAARASHVTVVV
ncbi:MAG: hypothetical protein WCF44_19235 [Candidatus Methylophosphatis roskildensis]